MEGAPSSELSDNLAVILSENAAEAGPSNLMMEAYPVVFTGVRVLGSAAFVRQKITQQNGTKLRRCGTVLSGWLTWIWSRDEGF